MASLIFLSARKVFIALTTLKKFNYEHIYAYSYTEEEREYFYFQKDRIAICGNETDIEEEDMNTWYHACPDEFFATRWAGEYMRNHPKKMKKFWIELQTALIQTYVKNGLIEG